MRFWKENPHWMIRDGEPDPVTDPDRHGCDLCEWADDGGVEASDLIWVPPIRDHRGEADGMWLCMECA